MIGYKPYKQTITKMPGATTPGVFLINQTNLSDFFPRSEYKINRELLLPIYFVCNTIAPRINY